MSSAEAQLHSGRPPPRPQARAALHNPARSSRSCLLLVFSVVGIALLPVNGQVADILNFLLSPLKTLATPVAGQPGGEVYFNDTEFSETADDLPPLIPSEVSDILKDALDAVTDVYETIGGQSRRVILAYNTPEEATLTAQEVQRDSFLSRVADIFRLAVPLRTEFLSALNMEIMEVPDILLASDVVRVLFRDSTIYGVFPDEIMEVFDEDVATSPWGGGTFETQEAERTGPPAAQLISDVPDVVLSNSTRRLEGVIPNDPYFVQQWQHVGDWGIRTPQAWEIWGGAEMNETVVALIDSGIDLKHKDLQSSLWTNEGEICGNGIDDDNNGYVDDCHGYNFINNSPDVQDDHGHGTASAGLIAGDPNNGVGVTGVCWGCKLMVIKALNKEIKGTTSGFVKALDYALMKKVRISNNSYGGRTSVYPALFEAVSRARHAGMLFVAASGNYRIDNDVDPKPIYPASFGIDNIISVGAINQKGELASFSSYGVKTVHIVAPGEALLTTALGNRYRQVTGTSYAVPLVAAAAALLWSREPTLTYHEVRERMMRTGKHSRQLEITIASGSSLDVYAAISEVSTHSPSNSTGLTSCSSNPDFCGVGGKCDYTDHGPTCVCESGFNLARSGVCEDVDECAANPCHDDATCENIPGSYICTCLDGYIGDGLSACQLKGPGNSGACKNAECPKNASCREDTTYGNPYECECPSQMFWDGQLTNSQCFRMNIPTDGPCAFNGPCGTKGLCEVSGFLWLQPAECRCFKGYHQASKSGYCYRISSVEESRGRQLGKSPGQLRKTSAEP